MCIGGCRPREADRPYLISRAGDSEMQFSQLWTPLAIFDLFQPQTKENWHRVKFERIHPQAFQRQHHHRPFEAAHQLSQAC